MSETTLKTREALFDFAREGNAAEISILLNKGVPPDVRDAYGVTPLMAACESGHLICVEKLVVAGADVNAVDKEKCSVLSYACSGGSNVKIVNYLLSHGANGDQRDAFGCTALMRAATKGDVSIVRGLINAGCDINAVSDNDETPLTFAIAWNQLEVVRALIEADVNINLADHMGWTPLQYALFEKNQEVTALLQVHGARLAASANPKARRAKNKEVKPSGSTGSYIRAHLYLRSPH